MSSRSSSNADDGRPAAVAAPGHRRHRGAQPGDVIVVEQRTGIDAAGWGGNLSLGAKLRGVAGVIIDGPARDVDEARELRLPGVRAQSTTRAPRAAGIVEDRHQRADHGRRHPRAPGDYVVADGSARGVHRAGATSDACSMPRKPSRARGAPWPMSLRQARRSGQVMGKSYETMLKKSSDAMPAAHDDDRANVQRASKLDTTSISDALDRLGIAGQCLNIKPLDHRFRLTGRAFTICTARPARRRHCRRLHRRRRRRDRWSCWTTAAGRTRPCGATS